MHAAADIPTAPAPASAPRAMQTSSSDAYQALGLKALQAQARAVFDVALACQKAGARDMSLREIRDAYERTHGTRIDVSTISARVNGLIAMGWLQRRSETRACTISKHGVRPVFVPAKQARLCA